MTPARILTVTGILPTSAYYPAQCSLCGLVHNNNVRQAGLRIHAIFYGSGSDFSFWCKEQVPILCCCLMIFVLMNIFVRTSCPDPVPNQDYHFNTLRLLLSGFCTRSPSACCPSAGWSWSAPSLSSSLAKYATASSAVDFAGMVWIPHVARNIGSRTDPKKWGGRIRKAQHLSCSVSDPGPLVRIRSRLFFLSPDQPKNPDSIRKIRIRI